MPVDQRNKESTHKMNNKNNLKIVLISLSILAALGGILFFNKQSANNTIQNDVPLVCISQIIEHISLDEERRGIIDALAAEGYIDGKTIKIMCSNAQGNLATAAQIAQMHASKKPNVMVAISTSSAQAALAVVMRQKIPLVFTAVTNPIQARLVQPDLATHQNTVMGISDALPIDSQITLIRAFLPHVKTIGVVYNSGEINSAHMVGEFKKACADINMTVIEATANKTSDIVGAVQSLVGRVDAIYVPNDNMAVSAMNSIVQVAEKAKIPVFAGDTGSVQKGALATAGYDRFMLGQKTGKLIVRVLRGENVQNAIDNKHPLKIYVNEKTCSLLGFHIPESIASDVVLIRQTNIKKD